MKDEEIVHIIAVYWTLKKQYGNHRLIEKCEFIWEDLLPFVKIRWEWFPIADFVWAMWDKLLKVELYKITDYETLQNVDRLEWHPNWYKRIEVTTASWKTVEVYDMTNKDFTDDSERFHVSDNIYCWNR